MTPLADVIAAALLWSTGGVCIKASTLSALELCFGRSLLAALTVAFLTRRQGFGINAVTAIGAVLYAALLLLFVTATKLTTAANAIFLQYTCPVYLLVLEPLMFRERFRPRDAGVVLVCLAGMSLFFVGKLRPSDVAGNTAALASGVCFALFTLLLRHPRAARVNRASSVIYGNALLALITAPTFFTHVGLGVATKDLLLVLFLGVVQIGVAYTLFTRGIARGVRSLDAGIVGYVEPVLNPVWVFLVIGERPAPPAILGGAIILSAVIYHMTVRASENTTQARVVGDADAEISVSTSEGRAARLRSAARVWAGRRQVPAPPFRGKKEP